MTTHHVVILGAGSAGAAAAMALANADAVTVTLLGRTGEAPYNRTLVNKGVALGLLAPEQAALPRPGAALIADTPRTSTSMPEPCAWHPEQPLASIP
jgi:3-phenylpropionate/trans-cinnamate dioxygenase ferredoxin reductase subunit